MYHVVTCPQAWVQGEVLFLLNPPSSFMEAVPVWKTSGSFLVDTGTRFLEYATLPWKLPCLQNRKRKKVSEAECVEAQFVKQY